MGLIAGVFHENRFWQLPLEPNSAVTIGASKNDTLSIPDSGLHDTHVILASKKGTF